MWYKDASLDQLWPHEMLAPISPLSLSTSLGIDFFLCPDDGHESEQARELYLHLSSVWDSSKVL